MSVWGDRQAALCRLGFPDYATYLESPLWRSVRASVLARDRRRCLCGKRANQVHHRRYDEQTLRGETLEHLVSVCRPCHRFGSVDAGRITEPAETDARIAARIAIKNRKKLRHRLEMERRKAEGRRRRAEKAKTTAVQRQDGSWDVSR